MKKNILTFILAALTVITCVAFSACGGVEAESVVFTETSVTLESKETKELTYSVQPENAKVKFEVSDNTVVKYEKGTLTALTAGTAIVKIYSPADETIYSECKVTVKVPSAYTAYADEYCKFVYPSSWKKTSVAGTLVSFNSSVKSANVNLVAETKNDSYFSASANAYKDVIIKEYNKLGLEVYFIDKGCTVQKSNLYGCKRIHVTYDYSVSLVNFHQEQMILNSGDRTYVITVTNASEEQTETIFSEFLNLK